MGLAEKPYTPTPPSVPLAVELAVPDTPNPVGLEVVPDTPEVYPELAVALPSTPTPPVLALLPTTPLPLLDVAATVPVMDWFPMKVLAALSSGTPGKVCLGANLTIPLLAMPKPVETELAVPSAKRKFRKPEGAAVLLPSGTACHWKL